MIFLNLKKLSKIYFFFIKKIINKINFAFIFKKNNIIIVIFKFKILFLRIFYCL